MPMNLARPRTLPDRAKRPLSMLPDRGLTALTSDRRAEANRQNACVSTGPRTSGGIEAVRFNALRHGLRSLETVIPGEDPEAWEAHRAGIVEDLRPAGAMELALAEQIAAKLWRLGRVVRHEADLIPNGQDRDELVYAYECGLGGKN